VSGIRQNSNPWLSDYAIFSAYRWLAWGAAALPLFWSGRPAAYGWILFATGLLNVPAVLLVQKYLRVGRHILSIITLDIFYTVLALQMVRTAVGSTGGELLFMPYAYSSLVLPGLVFGWRGGLLASLSFLTLDRLMVWLGGPPLENTTGAWVELALVMIAPPIFGTTFPFLVDLLRWWAARRERRAQQRAPYIGERLGRSGAPDILGFAALEHRVADTDSGSPNDAPLAAQAIRVRAAEPSVEDLRRVLFAQFPSTDMNLVAALELLAMRFGQQTGAATRVVMLGRARWLHPAHKDVLVRLAQEALLNVQQHAHAASTLCTLRYDVTSVELLLQDDGVGLLDGTYERPGLHALRTMHYRLAELGGRLDVFETEGGGVTVRATLPLE
jgi:hypothetical protein